MYIKQIFISISLLLVAVPSQGQYVCGELVTLKTHRNATMRYALAQPKSDAVAGEKIALILLPGGGGHADLDDKGCPRALVGNSPHGFADQQAEITAGIARFIRGSTY